MRRPFLDLGGGPMIDDASTGWIVQFVKGTSVESLDGFVSVEFGGRGRDRPIFKLDESGRLWKSACCIKVWDDGRTHVHAESHLTMHQRRTVAGLAEKYWRYGPDLCRREKWRRIRKSKTRPVASRSTCFWVQADREEPGYAAAHADMAMVVRSDPFAHDSSSQRWQDSDRATIERRPPFDSHNAHPQ